MAKTALLAKLTAQPGKRDDLLAVIADIGMSNAAGEPGTEVYAAHKDQNDADVVWFYELYIDQSALELHGGSEQMKNFGRAMRDCMAGRPELIFLDPVVAKGVDF
ncbi:putative quinol monooxygenase [Candidatus Poriferisodalis sp.]|uniref:putative quinol monooxygenase n=1 Tax=Candidatus Poriferisodalis sp. TaxID=3101277 RepID=UPI003B598B30